jgi:hypothetical protein
MKNLHRRRDAGELRHHVGQIHKKTRDHHEERGAESEFFPNQVGEPLTRHHPHPRAHLFGNVQRNGHGDERPQKSIAVLRAGLGVNGDPTGIVVHIGGDQSRPDYGQQQQQPPPQAAQPLLQAGAVILQVFYARSQ